MSNKIFLDSSILVEYTKGTKTDLYSYLAASADFDKCINQIVLSEYTFYLLIIEGGKAPLTLKRDGSIPVIIGQHSPVNILSSMTFLEPGAAVVPLYLRYMAMYNLLPNDALILATCKLYNINRVASFDGDFVTVCANEGIQLVQSPSDLTS